MFFYNLEIKMKTEEQTKYYNTPGEVLKKIKSRIYDLSVSYDSNEYMRVKDNFIAFINEMNENFKTSQVRVILTMMKIVFKNTNRIRKRK